jgi:hypothetical protein
MENTDVYTPRRISLWKTPEKIKIEFIKGIMAGNTFIIKKDIADDLIERGFAIKV